MTTRRFVQALSVTMLTTALLYGCQFHNPDALWKIVNESCVPANEAGKGPGKCSKVSPDGYVILKDIRGKGQHLLMPAKRSSGIEDVELRLPGRPNYWQYAWENRHYVSDTLGRPVPDDLMSLALNSYYGRSQNQYHIHIDCMSRDMRQALAAHDKDAPDVWTRVTLAGHVYRLLRVNAADAASVDAYELVRQRSDPAMQTMAGHTIFMAQAPGGFYVVDGYYDPSGAEANPGSAEELQDHSCKDVPLLPASR
jgi:CDP-diacylglycerol pyrophosphatase